MKVEAVHETRGPAATADSIRLKKAMLIGHGPINALFGSNLVRRGVEIVGVARSTGVFDATGEKKIADLSEWKEVATDADFASIAIPTEKDGEVSREYIDHFLGEGRHVILAEKAAIASNPRLLNRNDGLLRYTATVGGGTRMLEKISQYHPGEIDTLEAVNNGSFNYVSWRMRNGATRQEALRDAIEKGYAETKTDDFDMFFNDEERDVIRKVVIKANHSRMFILPTAEKHVKFVRPPNGDMAGTRCIVRMTKFSIEAGFIEDGSESWLPEGVDNILRINGKEIVRGPGAGTEATVSAMLSDFEKIAA